MRQQGRVRIWFDDRGFGFIENKKHGANIFVHHRNIIEMPAGERTLQVGQTVEFEIESVPKGLQADKVRVITQEVAQ